MSGVGTGTLALIVLDNGSSVAQALGDTSFELMTTEFRNRIAQFARTADKVLDVSPDKVCVLLRGVTENQQIELAGAKLQRLFDKPVTLVDRDVHADVRAAFVPPDAQFDDMDGRIRIAESGLREARRTGSGFVIRHQITTDLEQELVERTREVETGLARGEFVLFFQPKVHAGFGTVVGGEGLMRWLHSERGIVGPDQFLPFCRDPRLKRSLSWLAIKSAIATCSGWREPLGVAVNVPPTLVCDPELRLVVHDCLEIFGLAPERLTLEVTEDAMLEDPERAMTALSALREVGVRISIDDFGTGYSSLAYLRALELDELKVDRSFVTDMCTNARDRDIVKAMIDLAHTFSMKVVAEGIEDAATADLLRELGCDLLQGYHFGRPVPPNKFVDLVKHMPWGGTKPAALSR